MDLASLVVPSKEVEVDYPGLSGFKVKLSFLAREELIKIRKKAVTTKFRNRQPVEEFDESIFLDLYCKAVIKGWKGLKYEYLEGLMLVDLSSVKDKAAELEYTEANALVLMKNSGEFDAFVSETVSDLQNFPKLSSAK